MADVYFQCKCGQSLAVDEHGVGRRVKCVGCGVPLEVPAYEMEFTCELCRATMLAPLALGGSEIKCMVCGRHQTVPDAYGVRLWQSDSPPAVAAEVLDDDAPSNPASAERRRSRSWVWFMPGMLILAFFMGVRMGPKITAWARAQPPQRPAAKIEKGVAAQPSPAIKPPMSVKKELSTPSFRESSNRLELVVGADDRQSAATPGAAFDAPECPVAGQPSGMSGTPPEEKRVCPAPVAWRNADPARAAEERAKAWSEIAETCVVLDRLKRSGGRAGQSAEFLEKIGAARRKIAVYTQSYANRDLAYESWGLSLQRIYTYAFCREAGTFETAWSLLGEGLSLLEDADPEDETIKAKVKMEWTIAYAHAWLTTRPEACASLLDETRNRIGGAPPAELRAWSACLPWLEIRLLKNADRIKPERRPAFVEKRTRHLIEHLEQTGIPEERRVRALKSWIVTLDAGGRWVEAGKILESCRTNTGQAPAIPNWYLARLWLALYGEGDWKKARATTRDLTDATRQGKLSGNTRACRDVCEIYYSRIFSPGCELQRQSAKRLNERMTRKGKDRI